MPIDIGVGVTVLVVGMFKLQCRMTYVELFFQNHFYPEFYFLKLIPAAGLDDYMSVQRSLVLAHLPTMDVVNVYNSCDPGQRQNDCIGIDIQWATEHQCPDGAPDFGQTQEENVARNADGDGGINGFYPDFTDTSEKPHNRQKECLCRR
ncbi:MAG: hypothetical protein KKD00_12575, partial [Gammaproteobacteria bacterium]|nr:hypothetical protein [Gammaproteobacteria bacterium]